MNSVTLYSNGTAVVRRQYQFDGVQPLSLSLSVQKGDLDDMISSLSISGDVTLAAPPLYEPANSLHSKLALNWANAWFGMATQLVGAAVEVEAGNSYSGKLLGLNPSPRELGGTVFSQHNLVILTDKGIQQIQAESITAVRFTENAIQAEVDKALQASLNQIQAERRQVELTIQPKSDCSVAVVQYAIPVAAWKWRYQIRLSSERAELEGQAIVDNDTQEDWIECLLTVVTGEPITFSTNLAHAYRPLRRHVALVPDQMTGAVMPENVISIDSSDDDEGRMEGIVESPHREISVENSFLISHENVAEQTQADVEECGDFSIFQSPDPVTIPAKKSAILPLFRLSLDDVQTTLLYKEKADASRPFRAVRFKNQAAHSLGWGVCEIYHGSEFQGKSLLGPAKPAEEMFLIYAKETGVRVTKMERPPESRRIAIQVSQGVVTCETLSRLRVDYWIENRHQTAFPLEIEHPCKWDDSKCEISVSVGEYKTARIASGERINVSLKADAKISLSVVEERRKLQTYVFDINWLNSNMINLCGTPSEYREIQKCIDLQQEIDRLQSEIGGNDESVSEWEDQQNRLLKLIPAAHAEQATQWRVDLAAAEKELRQLLRVTIPDLKRQVKSIRQQLKNELAKIQFAWKEEEGKSPKGVAPFEAKL